MAAYSRGYVLAQDPKAFKTCANYSYNSGKQIAPTHSTGRYIAHPVHINRPPSQLFNMALNNTATKPVKINYVVSHYFPPHHIQTDDIPLHPIPHSISHQSQRNNMKTVPRSIEHLPLHQLAGLINAPLPPKFASISLAHRFYVSPQLYRFIDVGLISIEETKALLKQSRIYLANDTDVKTPEKRRFILATTKDVGGMHKRVVTSFVFKKLKIYTINVPEQLKKLKIMQSVAEIENMKQIRLLDEQLEIEEDEQKENKKGNKVKSELNVDDGNKKNNNRNRNE